MKRRLGSYTKRKPIVQLDDVPKENFGFGFKKETEYVNSPQDGGEANEGLVEPLTNQGHDDPLNAIKFVKSTPQPEIISEDLDSKLSDFLKEINDLDVKEASILKKPKTKEPDTKNVVIEPIAPTCAWQAVLDETSQCCYYWNVDTNQSTWEEPPEYTKYLVKYREFEIEYSKYIKDREEKSTNSGAKAEKAKRSSPSLVPYDGDEGAEDSSVNCSRDDAAGVENETPPGCAPMPVDSVDDDRRRISSKRPSDDDDNDDDGLSEGTQAKKIKLENSVRCALLYIDPTEIDQQRVQMEEAKKLLIQVSLLLERCEYGSQRIDGKSVDHIRAALLTRLEDWRAGYLPTPYFVSKIRECLSIVQSHLETEQEASRQTDLETNGRSPPAEESATEKPTVLEEILQLPPPPPPPTPPVEEVALPPLPETPPQPSASRSLISAHYGGGTDDEADGNSEASTTELGSSRTSSPFPPLDADCATESADNNPSKPEAKVTKKTKPLMTASISMRKKKVSSLVEKWQKVQQELGN